MPSPEPAALHAVWEGYKAQFIQADGRVIDPKNQGRSTSEGQAYGMIRALWAGDEPTFRRLQRWARDNLQGGDPGRLPAWHWGQRPDGSWGVIDPMPAADADVFMAWSLIGAEAAWGRADDRAQALALLAEISAREVAWVGERPVLLAGPWAKEPSRLTLNPSYWVPSAYRAFALVDPRGPWAALHTSVWGWWEVCAGESGLPSDWCGVDAQTGARRPTSEDPSVEAQKAVFGFEAFRAGWALAAEAIWYGEPRVAALAAPYAAALGGPAILASDGSPAVDYPYLGQQAALYPLWISTGSWRTRWRAERVYRRSFAPILEAAPARGGWIEPEDYYAQNWLDLAMRLVACPPAPGLVTGEGRWLGGQRGGLCR